MRRVISVLFPSLIGILIFGGYACQSGYPDRMKMHSTLVSCDDFLVACIFICKEDQHVDDSTLNASRLLFLDVHNSCGRA